MNTPSWPTMTVHGWSACAGPRRRSRRPAAGRACRAGSRGRVARGRRASAGRTRAWTCASDSPPGAHTSHGGRRQPARTSGQRARDLVLVEALPLALADLQQPGLGPDCGRPRGASAGSTPDSSAIASATATAVLRGPRERGVDDLERPSARDRQARRVVRACEPRSGEPRLALPQRRRAASPPGPGSGSATIHSDSPWRSRTSVASRPSGMSGASAAGRSADGPPVIARRPAGRPRCR